MKQLSDPRLRLAASDIVDLVCQGIEELKNTPADKWQDRHIKSLETYNKIVAVCLARKDAGEVGEFEETTDADLEASF